MKESTLQQGSGVQPGFLPPIILYKSTVRTVRKKKCSHIQKQYFSDHSRTLSLKACVCRGLRLSSIYLEPEPEVLWDNVIKMTYDIDGCGKQGFFYLEVAIEVRSLEKMFFHRLLNQGCM